MHTLNFSEEIFKFFGVSEKINGNNEPITVIEILIQEDNYFFHLY